MSQAIEKTHPSAFGTIRKTDENGAEYWSARELGRVPEYTDFRNSLKVVDKAKEACEKSRQRVSDHFVDLNEMVSIGSGVERPVESVKRSRYA